MTAIHPLLTVPTLTAKLSLAKPLTAEDSHWRSLSLRSSPLEISPAEGSPLT